MFIKCPIRCNEIVWQNRYGSPQFIYVCQFSNIPNHFFDYNCGSLKVKNRKKINDSKNVLFHSLIGIEKYRTTTSGKFLQLMLNHRSKEMEKKKQPIKSDYCMLNQNTIFSQIGNRLMYRVLLITVWQHILTHFLNVYLFSFYVFFLFSFLLFYVFIPFHRIQTNVEWSQTHARRLMRKLKKNNNLLARAIHPRWNFVCLLGLFFSTFTHTGFICLQ